MNYFCCVCGRPVASTRKGTFHPECLREDKRRRIAEKRRQDHDKFEQWLNRQRCPRCGAELGTVARRPRPTVRPPREASQRAEERPPDEETAVNAGRRIGAGIGQNGREMESGK
jgi:hypothetical protein